jgi:hypothetical protein
MNLERLVEPIRDKPMEILVEPIRDKPMETYGTLWNPMDQLDPRMEIG